MLKSLYKEYEKIAFLESIEIDLLRNLQKKESFFLLKKLQEQLRINLNEYLNTPLLFSKRLSTSYPLTLEILKYFGFNSTEKNLRIDQLPAFLKEGYPYLEKLRKKKNIQGKSTILKLKNFSSSDFYNKWPNKFNKFANQEFAPYASALFIHGSCSDLNLTPFSDLDTFMIINRNTILENDRLLKFKIIWDKSLKYLYKFDGLQHHNHMIATDFDLEFFPYHWLPPQVIDGSTVILGKKELRIKIVKSKYYILKNFYQLLQRYRDPKIRKKVYNRYTFKNDISVLALFPVLFLQGLGIDSTKKESFTNSNIAKVGGIEFYGKITEFRDNWKVPIITSFILSSLYQPYLRLVFLKYFMNKNIKSVFLEDSVFKEDFLQELIDITNKMSQTLITKYLKNGS